MYDLKMVLLKSNLDILKTKEKDAKMAKILLVDDSETLRTQVKKVLEKNGYEVVEGGNGLEGLEQIKAHSDIALILCDVNMPEMDGLTMIEKLAADTSAKKTPIFMLTTESSMDMKTRGKAAGVMAWVTKPFVEEKILAAIKKVLSM